MPALTVLEGANKGKLHPFQGDVVIGRSRECDVVLPCDTVSRRHARIYCDQGVYFVEDLGSTNGVYLNSEKVNARTPICDEDQIRIDSELLGFSESGQPYKGRTRPNQFWVTATPCEPAGQPASDPAGQAAKRDHAILHKLDISSADQRADVKPEVKYLAMLKIIRSLGVTLALDDVLPKILEALLMVFSQADQLDILLAEGPEKDLRVRARLFGDGSLGDEDFNTPRMIKRALAEMVMNEGNAILSADSEAGSIPKNVRAEGDAPPVPLGRLPAGRATPDTQAGSHSGDASASDGCHTVMCAPLKGPSRRPLGVIYVFAPNNSRPFNIDDLDVLASVAALAGQVVEHSRIHEAHVAHERLAAIGQMLASIAHESNNDLLSIQWGLKILSKNLAQNVAQKDSGQSSLAETVAQLQVHQQHLQRTFDDIQHFAGPLKLERAPKRLDEIWREAWSHLKTLCEKRHAKLIESVVGVDLTCSVDAFRIRQVFRNLFDNALSACPQPAEIEVRCAETLEHGSPAIVVAVSDNGPGIPDEDRGHAFEPFFSTKPRGTGLGLAITKRIVEAHGGMIDIRSSSRGAEIRFTLPR